MLTVDYDPPALFVDGFESGDYCQWSAVGGVPLPGGVRPPLTRATAKAGLERLL